MFKATRHYRETRAVRIVAPIVATFAVVALAYAATVPNKFVDGTVASAGQVNSNFSYLADRSWDLGGSSLYHNGKVGIGTSTPSSELEVKGDIKATGAVIVGTATASCNSSNPGAMRFNATTKAMEYCDGAAWAPLGAAKPRIWSGGCGYSRSGGKWIAYCLDKTDFNTASGYLNVTALGTVTFLKPGYFRLNAQAMCGGNPKAICQARLLINGIVKGMYISEPSAQWANLGVDVTWPFKANDTLKLEFYTPTGIAYRNWSSTGGYSRVQISHVGDL